MNLFWCEVPDPEYDLFVVAPDSVEEMGVFSNRSDAPTQ